MWQSMKPARVKAAVVVAVTAVEGAAQRTLLAIFSAFRSCFLHTSKSVAVSLSQR